jgi:hypothetical protein
MMKIIDRILLFIKYKNLSMRAFDKSIGVGNGYTSKQLKSRASVGSDVLERIIDTYPELNPLWLFVGDGKMIRTATQVEEPSTAYNTSFDELLEAKIEHIVDRKLQTLTDKIDNFPTLEDITEEILKKLDKH